MSELNRRTFVLSSAAAGLALASNVQAAQQPDKVRIGVIGTGGRGTGLCNTFQSQPGVEIVAVCDVDQARAERAAGVVQKASNATEGPKVYQDLRRVLDDRSIQAVVIATCNHWHAPAAILACKADKHVYVEKPVSYTPREGEMLLAVARKFKKHVQMGNQRRSWPTMVQAMERLRKGDIGPVYFGESWYQNNRPTIGVGKEADVPKGLDYALWQGPAPTRPFKSNYLHYNWHWFWHWGNGELGNNGVHILDLLRWGMNLDYPTRVTSSGGRYRYDDDQQTPDTHIVNFEFEGKKQIQWEGLSCSKQPQRVYHSLFHGNDGTMAISDTSYIIYDTAGKEKETVKQTTGDPLHANNFLNAIRTGERLSSDVEEAHKSTLLCHLGNIAHRTGRTLRCDPKNGHILGDKEAEAYWTREYNREWEPTV